MYSILYNRLCGWLLAGLGIVGLACGQIGSYMTLTPMESAINLCLGWLALCAARSRPRYSVLAAVMLGIGLFLWGLAGLAWPQWPLGTAEPLENAIHLLAGAWGMFVSVEDVLAWRNRAA